jgi:hypothetical protein
VYLLLQRQELIIMDLLDFAKKLIDVACSAGADAM